MATNVSSLLPSVQPMFTSYIVINVLHIATDSGNIFQRLPRVSMVLFELTTLRCSLLEPLTSADIPAEFVGNQDYLRVPTTNAASRAKPIRIASHTTISSSKSLGFHGNLSFVFDVKHTRPSLIQRTSPLLNLIRCVTGLPFMHPRHFISVPAMLALSAAYSPVRSGAFVQPTERIIFTIAGPDETGSIAHPDSAGSFPLQKWIRAEPSINQHNASPRQRVDRPTVRTSLTMQGHPHAPRCFHTLPTTQPHSGRRTLVVCHKAAAAVSREHRASRITSLAWTKPPRVN